MTIGSISFQSNFSIILIVIIIILVCIYFYLDMRKLKLQIENLDKNNESFSKEIEKINMALHHVFNNTVKKSTGVSVKEEIKYDKEEIKYDSEEETKPDKEEIKPDDFINLDNTQSSDNITDEIKETNIDILDDNNMDLDILNDGLIDCSIEEVDSEVDDDDDEGDNLDELIDTEGLDELINIDSDIVLGDSNEYLEMSVKELKEKCIELGLKHSGNKHTLAQRIVDKLG